MVNENLRKFLRGAIHGLYAVRRRTRNVLHFYRYLIIILDFPDSERYIILPDYNNLNISDFEQGVACFHEFY